MQPSLVACCLLKVIVVQTVFLQLRLLTPSNMPTEDSLDGLAFATLLEDDGFDQWSQAPRGTVKLELALSELVAGNHS